MCSYESDPGCHGYLCHGRGRGQRREKRAIETDREKQKCRERGRQAERELETQRERGRKVESQRERLRQRERKGQREPRRVPRRDDPRHQNACLCVPAV